jgi:TIGR03009 family protein
MKARVGLWVVFALLAAAERGLGQDAAGQDTNQQLGQPSAAQRQNPAYPDQPVMQQDPRVERRQADDRAAPARQLATQPPGQPNADPQQPPPPPFTLSPAEQAQLDRVLLFWEQSSQKVKTFHCKFTRWEYNDVFQPDKALYEDKGELRYEAPDKGLFSIEGPRADKWVCDGKSIYEFNFQDKKLVEHKLPREMQGKAIANGPVPFLFGAKVEHLKYRYHLRIVAPPAEYQNKVKLEAYPKFLVDAQNFKFVELILTVSQSDMQPWALRIHQPGGKNRTAYVFDEPDINKKNFVGILQDPWHPRVPSGWQKLVEEAPQMPPPAQREAAGNGPPAVGSRPNYSPPIK